MSCGEIRRPHARVVIQRDPLRMLFVWHIVYVNILRCAAFKAVLITLPYQGRDEVQWDAVAPYGLIPLI